MRFRNSLDYFGPEKVTVSMRAMDELLQKRRRAARISGNGLTTRIPSAAFSTANVREQIIRSNVTKPRRLAPSRVAGKRSANLIHGDQRIRPPVPRPEHVPGTQDCGVQTGRCDGVLAFGSNRDVGVHHRRRMRDAQINEVAQFPHILRPRSHPIGRKEGRLGEIPQPWRGWDEPLPPIAQRCPRERSGRRSFPVERIAENWSAPCRKFFFRTDAPRARTSWPRSRRREICQPSGPCIPFRR